jgi:hypothetical protein
MTQGRNAALCGPLRAPANALIFRPKILWRRYLVRISLPDAVSRRR